MSDLHQSPAKREGRIPAVPSGFFTFSACDLHDAGEAAGIEIIAAIAHEVS
jgi:hypothetical protein